MNNFNKKILEKIKEGNIKQESKFIILIKRYSLWLFFIVNTFVSSIAFTFFLRTLTDSFGKMHDLKVNKSFFLSNILWIWFIIFIIFSIISIINFKHTKNGWKYQNYKIILSSVILSLVFGLILYGLKMDKTAKHHLYLENSTVLKI